MEEAIKHYMDIVRYKGINIYHFPVGRRLSNVDPELMRRFNAGEIFVARQEHSDFEIFNREIGYQLPKDIADYLNAYWQPGVFGYYKDLPECFMLFSAIRHIGEKPDDFLLRSGGLIAEAKRWVSYDGDLNRYMPIGIYDAYSCSFLLYEVETGRIFIEDTMEHIQRYGDIYAKAFSGEPWNDPWKPEDAVIHVRELLESKQAYGLEYVLDSKVVGFILGTSMLFHYGRTFEINDLAVDPEYQRRGIAKELLEKCLADIKAQGMVGVHLITAGEGVLPEFYAKNGFKKETEVILMGAEL